MKHIIPVRSAMKQVARSGCNPYDNHAAIARAFAAICKKRGAKPLEI
jgi:hypothetical protein